MSFQKIFLAATSIAASVNAHVTMKSPVPYSVDKIDNGPISKTQYPCKSQNGFTVSTMNQMAAGTKQQLVLDGSAVHGGGSCQLSITLDTEPTANSVFKVIQSMEGGCPSLGGTAGTHDFELPTSIPNGKATFAWTWFSKLAGQPELYMNCAPIEVTGGASDKTAFEALPNMFVANIEPEKCKNVEGQAVAFPNPGSVVVKGSTNDAVPPMGSACGASSGGSSPAQPSGGSSPAQSSPPAGQPSSPPGQYTPAPKSSAVAQPSPPAGGQPAASPRPSASAAPPSNLGGVFAPGASSVAGAPALTSTTLVTVTAVPTPAKPSGITAPSGGVPAPAPAKPSSTPASPAPGGSGGSGSTCTTNGAVVCNGTTQFGLCNNGNVVWQAVAPGTTCSDGVISKRAPRPRYRSPRIARPVDY